MKQVADSRGWTKTRGGAKYAGVCERIFRPWYKQGLRHVRLPSGTILVSYAAIDEYLQRFEVQESKLDDLVDEVVGELM